MTGGLIGIGTDRSRGNPATIEESRKTDDSTTDEGPTATIVNRSKIVNALKKSGGLMMIEDFPTTEDKPMTVKGKMKSEANRTIGSQVEGRITTIRSMTGGGREFQTAANQRKSDRRPMKLTMMTSL